MTAFVFDGLFPGSYVFFSDFINRIIIIEVSIEFCHFISVCCDLKNTQMLWGTDGLVSQSCLNGHINTIREKWMTTLRYLTFTTVGRVNLKKKTSIGKN